MASLLFLILNNSVRLSDISPLNELLLKIPISMMGFLSLGVSFLNRDVIVCDIMELLSSLSLFPRSLLLSSSISLISDPDDLSPKV